jgi:hypothetical protein
MVGGAWQYDASATSTFFSGAASGSASFDVNAHTGTVFFDSTFRGTVFDLLFVRCL